MRTVTTISLNGNAYPLDASGCEALGAYLGVAEQRLAANPDRQEILADLEQAIADKFGRYLGPHKNVVSAEEVAQVLREMGPVDGGAAQERATDGGAAAGAAGAAEAEGMDAAGGTPGPGQTGAAETAARSGIADGGGGAARDPGAATGGNDGPGHTGAADAAAQGATGAGTGDTAGGAGAAGADAAGGTAGAGAGAGAGHGGDAAAGGSAGAFRRLYRIREGAMIGGVCNGLAAYFRVDVTIVRLLFVIFAFITWGVAILAYLVLMSVIPPAQTSEQHAAAHGRPFNAEELIGSGNAGAGFKDGANWQQHWREQRRMWRDGQRAWRSQRRQWRRQQRAWTGFGAAPGAPPPPSWTGPMHPAPLMHGIFSPFGAVAGVLLFAGFVFVLVSIVNRHAVLGWVWPADLPRWVGIVIIIVLYRAIAWPLRYTHYAPWYGPAATPAWAVAAAALGALMWLAFIAAVAWLAWQHGPELHDFLRHFIDAWRAAFTPGQTQTSVTL